MVPFDVVTCMEITEWTGQLAMGVCVKACVCVCMGGGIRGVPNHPVNYKERGGREGGDGDESVAHRGADDEGLYGIEGG